MSKKYLTYQEAIEAVRCLGFVSSKEYQTGYKQDPKLHSAPYIFYAEDWVDWYDFLGSDRPKDKKYPSYREAKEGVKGLGFTTSKEYEAGYQSDPELPAAPHRFYAEHWVDWYDFLGNERLEEKKYLNYHEAGEAARSLKVSSIRAYKATYKKDRKLPCHPDEFYAVDWKGWNDFLGKEPNNEKYYSYEEAQDAVKTLGIKGYSDYQKSYKKDPKLPAAPSVFYSNLFLGWYEYLGKDRPIEKYSSYEQARVAARAFGVLTRKEYQSIYAKDPKLCLEPFAVYKEDWVDWCDFLGTERKIDKFYKTYNQAREAAENLNCTCRDDYYKTCKVDPKLHSSPTSFYKSDWVDWYDFLGNDRPDSKYTNYEQARLAAISLGFSGKDDYKVHYRQDSRLPVNPQRSYSQDWKGWYDFLGNEQPIEKYSDYKLARNAVIKLGVATVREYNNSYHRDPKLPCNPDEMYSDEWTSWYEFFDKRIPHHLLIEQEYPRLYEAVVKYVDEGVNQASKLSNLRCFVCELVSEQNLHDEPGALLSKTIPFPQNEYVEFVNSTGETQKRQRHNICVGFLDWVMDEYCSDEDDEGVLTPLSGYRNPLKTILKGLLDQLPTARPSESVKPVLPMSVILRGRAHLIPPEAKTFKDLYQLHQFYDDCWIQIDPSLIDAADPNCIYRDVEICRKGKVTQIWSPVKLIALYTLLNMPLRGQQILWLDSGEGDEFIPVWQGNKVLWIKNTNKLATTKRQQGFIKKDSDDSCGSYITTNKTGRKVGGYSVPWIPDSVAYWIIQLRDWQSKYNPLNELTPWTKIKLRQKTNEKILKARGKQAFLFRDPASMACKDKVSPMFTTTAYTRSLPALLFNIQQPSEDLAQPVTGSTTQYKSQFTPHCLRVSLITAYIVDGGASIHVISKLVGHASLVMTIYYTKVGHSRMKQALGDAEKKAVEHNVDRIQDLILQKRIDEAKPELIATDRSILDGLGTDWPSAAYQVTSLGICPMGGAGCNEGGELLIERSTEMTYAPVAAGYLGARNCPRCRFFITGPAFFGGLSAIANEVILEMKVLRVEYHDLEEQMQDLEDERYDLESSGQPFKNGNKLKKITASYEEKAKKLDVLLCDFQHLYRFISQSIEILNTSDSDKNQLIVSDQYVEMGMQLSEQESEFRLLAEVCSNAEIYTSSSASRALPLLAQMLDKLADTNGIAPSMFRLTEKQQLKAANQIVSLIMKSAQNDWHVADRLINGAIMLEDLGQDSQLMQLHKEIESIMHGSLTLPIIRENCDG